VRPRRPGGKRQGASREHHDGADQQAEIGAADESRPGGLGEFPARGTADLGGDTEGTADGSGDAALDGMRHRHVGQRGDHPVLVAGGQQAADDGDAEGAADLYEHAVRRGADARVLARE